MFDKVSVPPNLRVISATLQPQGKHNLKESEIVCSADLKRSSGSQAFQVGNVPEDGDVFGSPTRSAGAPLANPNAQLGITGGINTADRAANEALRLSLSRNENDELSYAQNLRGHQLGADEASVTVRSDQRLANFAPGTGELDSQPRTLRSRPSDLGARHQVGGVDAQCFYPPTACVFVAK
jgi:hypothetical protein